MNIIENIIISEIKNILSEKVKDKKHKKSKKKTKSNRETIKYYLKNSNKIDSAVKKFKNNNNQEKYIKVKNREGNNIDKGDEARLRRTVNNGDLINIAALARKLYPDHTPEGAQSQLRKKLDGLKNDNGSEYHLSQREASLIRKALKNIKS